MSEYQETIDFIKSFGIDDTKARQLNAGVDIMRDAGYPLDKIETWMGDALRTGHNPEEIARKVVAFGKILSRENK